MDQPQPAGIHRAQVLVVDDERFFREAIREILIGEEIPFSLAEDGAQAIELAADPRIGVMILDIHLPDQSGLEVLEKVRALRPELRVVVLSSQTEQEVVLQALRLGATDYLAKPIHEEEMRLSIHRALESFAVARDWSRLRARLEQLNEELERIARLDAHESAEVVQSHMIETAARLLDASKTSLLIQDRDGDTLEVKAALGHKVPIEELDRVALGEGVAGQVVAKGEPVLVGDVEADGRFALPRPGHYRSPSFVAVPLAGPGGEARGALCATEPDSGRVFAQEDVTLLRLLALAAAPRLAQASNATEVAAPETENGEVSGGEAELARVVCDAINREVEPKQLLANALRGVAGALDAGLASIYLQDPNSDTLRLESQWEGAGVGDRDSLPLRGLSGSVMATGHPVASAEVREDPRFDPSVDTDADGAAAPCLIVPLCFRGKALGLARVFGDADRLVSPRITEVLGASLSAAVRNTILFRSLADSIDELALARRTHQA